MSNDRAAEEANLEKFSELAADYGRGTERPDLDALVVMVGDLTGKKLLDTAAGRGACALRMASRGAEIQMSDLTHAMLAEARSDAIDQNLDFRASVAHNGRLPFPPATFDVVTCTRAYHHMPDVRGALLEARRVLKTSGRLLITDHSGPDDPEAMEVINKISRLRDASHAEMLSSVEWRNMLADVGFELRQIQHVESRQDLGAVYEAAGDLSPEIENLFKNATPKALEAIGFDGVDPAGFTSRIVVIDAVSAG